MGPGRAGPGPRTVAEVLDRPIAAHPDRVALVARHRRYTYAELDAAADRAARALHRLGVRPGDRIGASLPNDAEVVVAFHGAMRLNAVWVGVNRALAPAEKAFILRDAGVSVFLGDTDMAHEVETVSGDLPALARIAAVDPGDGEWARALAAADGSELPSVTVDPDAPAGIAYTSGTTGFPKGVVHSQRNLLLPGAVTVASRGYGPDLVKGDCLPLTILNMMVLTTLLVAQSGGCCVVMDGLDPAGIADWCRSERVTTWNGVPALLDRLALSTDVDPTDLASLDDLWTGGSDCPEAIRSRVQARFGHDVRATYGLTEAPTIVSIDDRGGPHVAGASGRPLPHLRVSVRDDAGRELPVGETGEIFVGPAPDGRWAGRYRPMLGYWNRPDETTEALRDGVLHTGDVGFLDSEGYLFVRDRKSLLIIRGGANVYPAEVERVVHEVPGVTACAVVGVQDERLGERVMAAVALEPGADVTAERLTEHCRASLAHYKVPERFVVVDDLPRNAMGKIRRAELTALLAGAGRADGHPEILR